MIIDLTHDLFKNAIPVIERIERAGYEAFFVGGCVRDLILDRPIHDIDIATSAKPEEIKQLFSRTIDVGIEHGTVMVLYDNQPYEITTYRSEGSYSDHRRPDHVSFVRNLKEDLLRRDFTMNALALSRKGEVIDYYNGQEDIVNRKITCVGNPVERFNEDSLRIMRALRFMSQLDFSIENSTLLAIKKLKEQLQFISIERITVEWHKLCLGQAKDKALNLMLSLNVTNQLPEIDRLKMGIKESIKQSIVWEDEADIWATILFFSNQNQLSVPIIQKSFKLSNKLSLKIKKRLNALILISSRDIKQWTNIELYELNDEIRSTIQLAKQIFHDFMDDDAIVRYTKLPIHSKQDMAIDGRDLKLLIPPSKIFGIILNDLEGKILLGKLTNDRSTLTEYIKQKYSAFFTSNF